MNILALESSAVACSVAVCREEFLIAQSFQNSGLTHSRTLMPMVESLLRNSGLSLSDMDVIAVAAGPGSFTGLRIGVATAKGLAWSADKPCAGVSTLEAMAWGVSHMGLEICAVMDARRNQVYNARFGVENGRPVRLTPDRAIDLDTLLGELQEGKKAQILVGDGALLCYNALNEACQAQGISLHLPPPHLRYQSAWGVARAALESARAGRLCSPAALVPVYHRLSQAERERLAASNKETEHG